MAVAVMRSSAVTAQSTTVLRQRSSAAQLRALAPPRAGNVVTQAFFGPSVSGRTRPEYVSSSPVMGAGNMDLLKRSTSSVHPVHPMDLRTREEAYEVQADCPGVLEEDISVEVSPDNILTVAGARRSITTPADSEAALYDMTGLPDAPSLSTWDQALEDRTIGRVMYRFKRSFVLPEDAVVEGISAALNKGVLTVTIPRVMKPKPRRVAINSNQTVGQRMV